jgi:hypothetical protein
MAQVRAVDVYDQAQLTQTINLYVMQGFAVANREAHGVTMVKPKQFSVVWAVVGFFLCLLPLLVYLIVYATQQDQVVMIRLLSPGAQQSGHAALSPDGNYWWDGTAWQPVRPQLEG